MTHPSRDLITIGSQVVLDDLDSGAREVYVLVASFEANPAAGRISDESPIGRAVTGRRMGDVVSAHAPARIRHLRVAAVTN
jgi:transcription elongation factor GreA